MHFIYVVGPILAHFLNSGTGKISRAGTLVLSKYMRERARLIPHARPLVEHGINSERASYIHGHGAKSTGPPTKGSYFHD